MVPEEISGQSPLLVTHETPRGSHIMKAEPPPGKGMPFFESPCGYGCALALGGTWPILALNANCPEHGSSAPLTKPKLAEA
jgi:hypothetical protein